MEEVKLLGFWPSPYSHRVIWALKLKGISYEYMEEDLKNKSELLLQYNPVYKKIPVLVHGGKPIAESLVILEYIEETWPKIPLLPKDPYQRASARFWVQYGVEKGPILSSLFTSSEGEERDKAAKEVLEVLKILEIQGLGNKKFFGGETISMVDIAYGWLAHWFECIEEVVGVKLLEPSTLPGLHAWVQNLKQVPVIKENLPDYERLIIHMKNIRVRMLSNHDSHV
ncbi:glutathione S-transferase U7 [Ziziphus jujuba]|uniref:glutathione transferase n=2 Tax=Ziziphus jujuba TaxID=326968 RepID=A0A6P4A366_ZIZJJ|nr:glutathione S-transferase U7 [Ziziphus jujuba]